MRRVGSQFLWSVSRLRARLALSAAVLVVLAAGLVVPGGAAADQLVNLGDFGSPNGAAGGQLTFPRGVAVNRSGVGAPAGSVYVSEATSNHRISQFTADGEFVRTWGFDVIVAARPDSSVPPNSNGTGFEICDVTNGNLASDCKAGAQGAAAGQLANPAGIAVDQSNGYLYVPSQTNRRVDVFSGTGQFAGAFGWGVDTGAAAPEVCTTASTCQVAGAAGGDAGRFGVISASVPGIDPSTPGKVYVPDPANLRVAQYSTTISGGVLTAATFDKGFGWDVIPGGAATLESCTIGTTCQTSQPSTGGNNPGQFTAGSPSVVAVDSTGALYVTSGPTLAGSCSADTPCRIQKFSPDASSVTDFGPSSGPGQLTFTSGAAPNAVAAFNVAVDPDNDHVYVQRRESTTSYRVLEFDSDGDHLETHPGGDALSTATGGAGLATNQSSGLAISAEGRVYALVGAGAATGQSRVYILGPIDPPGVAIQPVSDIGSTTATFNATVEIPEPGAPTFSTTYRFEYSKNGVDWVGGSDLSVADGSAGVHGVSSSVGGLEPNTLYTVRLVASTGGTPVVSSTVTFTTDASAPRVALTFVDEVSQTQARLGAHVDPEGLDASYHFEWGTEPCSEVPNPCSEVPSFERQIGDGTKVVVVNEPIDGLEQTSTYHYRVVVTNSEDTTYGPDQTFETLNQCGLTDNRCYELVSPADKGPVGAGGDRAILAVPLQFQANREGPGIAYNLAYGNPDATAGGEVLYQAARGPASWTSFQLGSHTPAVSAGATNSVASVAVTMSPNLDCGFFFSSLRLADDAPQATLDAGGSLLYRRNGDGTWTTVTDLVATRPFVNINLGNYVVVGATDDCERVVFATQMTYPGVPGQGSIRSYEWVNGALRPIGLVPGPSGPVYVAATVGTHSYPIDSPAARTSFNFANSVSANGERIAFSAFRQTSVKPQEVGKLGVFVSEDGGVGVDVSASQTEVANDGPSRYEDASADGGHVFFTARYGLADNDSSTGMPSCSMDLASGSPNGAGCDLYRYSLGDGSLTDLSAPGDGSSNSQGASVAGVLATSDDGSRVYFAARGQLVPGKGKTQNQNIADNTHSIYLYEDGELTYIAPIGVNGIREALVGLRSNDNFSAWITKVTPDGGKLLFISDKNVTGYDSGGKRMAYLYDAETDQTVCISCRKDLKPPVVPPPNVAYSVLPSNGEISNYQGSRPPVTLTSDGKRVFFYSYDHLATGASEGQPNLYQWEEGQVSFIANSAPNTTQTSLLFAGASSSGDDVYFTTVDRLTWQDVDGRLDVYDARVGGGFAEPPPAPDPCDPLGDGACQDTSGSSESSSDRATETSQGGQPVADPRMRISVGALSRAQRSRLAAGRRVRVRVVVSRPGTIVVGGTARIAGFRARVLSATVKAPRAGRYEIPVVLSSAAGRQVRKTGGLRVSLAVRLAGQPEGAVRSLVLRKPASGARKSNGARTATTDRRAGK